MLPFIVYKYLTTTNFFSNIMKSTFGSKIFENQRVTIETLATRWSAPQKGFHTVSLPHNMKVTSWLYWNST